MGCSDGEAADDRTAGSRNARSAPGGFVAGLDLAQARDAGDGDDDAG